MTELLRAARNGNLKGVKELLNQGANVNARDGYGRSAIHRAAYFGHLPVVRLLLNRGANINARTTNWFKPIHWAAMRGHSNVVKELLNRGANANNVLNRHFIPENMKNAIREYEQLRVNRAKAHTRNRAPLENLAKYVFHPSRVKLPNNIAETLKKESNRRMKNLKNENNKRKKNPNIVGTMKIPHWIS